MNNYDAMVKTVVPAAWNENENYKKELYSIKIKYARKCSTKIANYKAVSCNSILGRKLVDTTNNINKKRSKY